MTKDKIEEEICPVCGYYCLGKGGIGCIDKKGMYEKEKKIDIKKELYIVTFKNGQIYETLSSNMRPYGALAIFRDRIGAEKWIKVFCKEETYKPEIKILTITNEIIWKS